MIDATGLPQSALLLSGTSEIGLAVVERLAAGRLEEVLLAGRDEEGLEAARARLGERGVRRVEVAACDVTSVADIEALREAVGRSLGSLDLVVLSVGKLGTAELGELGAGPVAELFAVNASGPAAALMELASLMAEQGYGRIVVISSVAALRPRRDNFVYGAAKAGLDGFAGGLAEALRGTGVEVMIVRPGFVHTRMTAGRRELPFACEATDVAEAVLRGLAAGSRVVYVPAFLQYLFALVRVLPQAVFRRLSG